MGLGEGKMLAGESNDFDWGKMSMKYELHVKGGSKNFKKYLTLRYIL